MKIEIHTAFVCPKCKRIIFCKIRGRIENCAECLGNFCSLPENYIVLENQCFFCKFNYC